MEEAANPWWFYVLTILAMLLGNLAHIIKKVVQVRETVDNKFRLSTYLVMYRYKTYLVVIAGFIGYITLNSTNELTYLTAFMAGYMANSLGGIEAGEKT